MDDGTIEAMYIRFSDHKVAKSIEHLQDILIADYDIKGRLVGLEILARVKAGQVVRLVPIPRRKTFRSFFLNAAPEELVVI